MTHFGGHLSITESSERPLRSPLVQMKAESEHFKLAYHKIWICISRYGLDTTKAPYVAVSHAPRRPPPRPACCGPASELGCSSCFIRPLERVQTRARSRGSDWPRLGTKPAILVGSSIARVGAELDRGRLPTRYLGRAGCLSNPTGVWIKRGAPSPVGFGPGVGSGRIRGGSGTGAMVAPSVLGPLPDQPGHLRRQDSPRATLVSIR